jgi:hypothetical protein
LLSGVFGFPIVLSLRGVQKPLVTYLTVGFAAPRARSRDPLGETGPLVEKNQGVLVSDDSMVDHHYARHIELVTHHRSSKHRETVRGINLISLVSIGGDRETSVVYGIYSQTDGKTKSVHFCETMLRAKGWGFAPRFVLFDSWYTNLENLK